jgi:sarcosine oxidase / L-pipecolate oxidase
MARFLPNIGKYMLNVLSGQSNGPEKDKAWGWKSNAELEEAKRGGKADEQREFQEFVDKSPPRPNNQARL